MNTSIVAVDLVGGSAWNPALPPEEQDLAGHFALMGDLFATGELLANGPVAETGHGLYLYAASQDRVREIIAGDEGVTKNVIAAAEISPWLILVKGGQEIFEGTTPMILDYRPGSAYERSADMNGQSPVLMGPHVEYVGSQAAAGVVWIGGPVDASTGHGRYIILTGVGRPSAAAFVAADPGVKAGLFEVATTTWQPLQIKALS